MTRREWVHMRWVFLILQLLQFQWISPTFADDSGVRDVLQPLIDSGMTAGAAMGTQVDGVTRTYAFGRTVLPEGPPPDSHTLFEIGSISKVFTGMLLSAFVHDGSVSLDDPIARYLPDSVPIQTTRAGQITLRQLATHTSGLPRLPTNLKPADPDNPYADYTVENLCSYLTDASLTLESVGHHSYSNLGMGLLGHVLSLAAGESWEDLVRTRISVPSGMPDTCIMLSAEQAARLTPGYIQKRFLGLPLRFINRDRSTWFVQVRNWDIPTLAGAGGLRSTVDDLLRFATTILHIYKEGESNPFYAALKPQVQIDGKSWIGLGWILEGVEDGKPERIWHNGGTGGYRSFLGIDLRRSKAVVILSNTFTDQGVDKAGWSILEKI